MSRKNGVQVFVIGLLLLIAGAVFFLYWGRQKEIWFCDEIYTYESANGFEQNWPAENIDQWMTGRDVEAFFSADSENLSLNDISVRLYCDHVPLYFWIFRVVSFYLFHGSGSMWIGLSINLVFYLAILGLVYGTFYKLTHSACAAAIVTLLTCVTNRLLMEQATMLRMYLMMLLLELLLLLQAAGVLRDAGKGKLSPGTFAGLFLVSLAGLLTHYHFWIFYAVTAALFCLWLLIQAIRKKSGKFFRQPEVKCVLAWLGNFAAALLVTVLLFPYCKWNLNRGKGEMALHSVFVFSAEKIQHILWGYRRLSVAVFGEKIPVILGLVVMFGCIVGGAVLLYRQKETFKLTCLLLAVLVAQAYQLAVCFTLPDVEEERYIWGSITIMMLCMAWGAILLLQRLAAAVRKENSAARKGIKTGIAAVLALGILVGEMQLFDHGNGVAYLSYPGKDVDVLREYREIPWVVYGPTVGVYSYYDWLIPEKICFVTMDQTQEDAETLAGLAADESFILYIYADYCTDALKFIEQETGKQFEGEYLFNSTNLSVYLVNTVN